MSTSTEPDRRPEALTPAWRLVAEREVATRIREKSFLIGLGLTLLFLVGFFVVSAVTGGPEDYEVAVVGRDAPLVAQAERTLQAGTGEDTVTATQVASADAAERLVADGDADAALLRTDDGWEVVGDEGVDTMLRGALSQVAAQATLSVNAERQGVDLAALESGTTVEERLLGETGDDVGSGERSTVAFVFSLVFLMTAIGYGMAIAQSVLVEKENRVVEILAAAIPIRSLLWGKILGNTLLALGQLLVVVAVGVVGLLVTGRSALLGGIGAAVVWYVAFFVLGFLALAALWSVAGSLSSRQEDLQSTTLPMQMLLFVPYFVGAFAGDRVVEVASMVPIASTMLMPSRMAQESVPLWQVVVAIALTVAAAVVFVRLGSRIYERTLLHTTGRIGFREALRLGTR